MKLYLCALLALLPITLIAESLANSKLLAAIAKGDAFEATQALSEGADSNTKDPFGRTPLFNASWDGRDEIAALLISRGAPTDQKDKMGSSPLHKAAQGGHSSTIKLLINEGANREAIDEKGNTPLHEAALFNKTEAAKALLELGADRSIKNRKGATALDIAIDEKNQKLIDLFKTIPVPIDSKKRKREFGQVVKLLQAQNRKRAEG